MSKKTSKLLSRMTMEQKVAQVQCINVTKKSLKDIEDYAKLKKIGSVFAGNLPTQDFKKISEATLGAEIPVIFNADLVHGAGSRIFGATLFPHQLGCSATGSLELMEKMGEITAQEGRACGVHWTFGPVADIALNIDNPMMHVRTSGDDPEHILKMTRAMIKGIQKDRLMAATAKHFPGDGADPRDTHISTLINRLSREEWMSTYGLIWKGLIEAGVMSIMGGFIALPFVDAEYEDAAKRYKGPRPGALSKKVQIDFLRGELGFEGVIVSDAMGMLGLTAHVPRAELSWRLLEAGTDMLLWPDYEYDTPLIIKAIEEGKLSEQRLDDAVSRILEMKEKLGLFDHNAVYPMPSEEVYRQNYKVAQETADRSITIIRDVFNAIPMKHLKPGSKVLTLTSRYTDGERNKRDTVEMVHIDDQLTKRGFVVDHLTNPTFSLEECQRIREQYDAIFVNIQYPPRYGSVRLYGDSFALFTGSWWVDNPKVVFTSFGDPYKLFDLPSLHSYINAYGHHEVSQRAAVKVWLGEIPAVGKSPVELKGFFERQV